MPTLHPLRAADLLIRQHGGAAADHAVARHRQMLARGDADAAAGWRQIIDAIHELERTERHPGEQAH